MSISLIYIYIYQKLYATNGWRMVLNIYVYHRDIQIYIHCSHRNFPGIGWSVPNLTSALAARWLEDVRYLGNTSQKRILIVFNHSHSHSHNNDDDDDDDDDDEEEEEEEEEEEKEEQETCFAHCSSEPPHLCSLACNRFCSFRSLFRKRFASIFASTFSSFPSSSAFRPTANSVTPHVEFRSPSIPQPPTPFMPPNLIRRQGREAVISHVVAHGMLWLDISSDLGECWELSFIPNHADHPVLGYFSVFCIHLSSIYASIIFQKPKTKNINPKHHNFFPNHS